MHKRVTFAILIIAGVIVFIANQRRSKFKDVEPIPDMVADWKPTPPSTTLSPLTEIGDSELRSPTKSALSANIPISSSVVSSKNSNGDRLSAEAFNTLEPGRPRKFSITVERVLADGTVIANGAYFDIDPSVTLNPEMRGPGARSWTPVGRIAIAGLKSAVSGGELTSWLERDATVTYTHPLRGPETVASFRAVQEPSPKQSAP